MNTKDMSVGAAGLAAGVRFEDSVEVALTKLQVKECLDDFPREVFETPHSGMDRLLALIDHAHKWGALRADPRDFETVFTADVLGRWSSVWVASAIVLCDDPLVRWGKSTKERFERCAERMLRWFMFNPLDELLAQRWVKYDSDWAFGRVTHPWESDDN